ncbi:uncharacterized protein LOC114519851 [Dendronephthya gigantea]|uniref:uncharacterized protein LOC114519851 n=1 Tax=Dendronephthya gigantea TaxID=151771 RepID=UPI00106C70E5|nr:uncharacterized protein LOC114519851 [Dendronephthya gigantea]
MDIPYYESEEIRFNCTKFSSRGEQVLLLFNESHSFDRRIFKRCLDELGRKDLKDMLLPMENEDGTETTLSTQTQGFLEEQLVTTPLSPRELYRLSRRVVDWNCLAGLLNIPAAERSNIRSCDRYYDDRSRAEKILSIFNRREEFSREQLARCLDEIKQNDLIGPILNGDWRTLVIP